MQTYFHLLRRDLKDSASSWATGLGLLAMLVAGEYFYSLSAAPFTSLYYFAMFLAVYWPSFPYRRLIWGNSAPLSRDYLKTLPINRTWLFWMTLGREIPAQVPPVLYVSWIAARFNLLAEAAARYHGYLILPRTASPSEYFLGLGLLVLFVVYSTLTCAAYGVLEERLAHTNGRWERVRGRATLAFAILLTQVFFLAIAWTAFRLFFNLSVGIFFYMASCAAIPLTCALVFWIYKEWNS